MLRPQRNLLPQDLGFSPGTSLIGNFGSTAARFQRIPMDGAPESHIPGPGAYNPPPIGIHKEARREKSWGTDLGHKLELAAGGLTPGPGTYGDEQQPSGGMLTDLRRSWPGVASMSSFGTNAALPSLKAPPQSDEPGPGQYDVINTAHFLSRSHSAFSPYLSAARSETGSRLRRDMDAKRSASFASTRPAHKLPAPGDETGAAISSTFEGPAPNAYLPSDHTIAHHMAKGRMHLSLRPDYGVGSPFATSNPRFRPMGDQCVAELGLPGPGAHTLKRFDGEKPSNRRPRSDTPTTRAPFLVNAARFGSGKAASDPDAILDCLAYGPMGAVGRPLHAQQAGARVAKATAVR